MKVLILLLVADYSPIIWLNMGGAIATMNTKKLPSKILRRLGMRQTGAVIHKVGFFI